ncbi:MAG: hypothetical protein K0Q63_2036 [Paenibacillus sp.]|nr:hypothetical protein [Paenibacillus sp.]
MKVVLILMVFIFSLAGCSDSQSVKISDKNGTVAKDYLESKGYKVASYEGASEAYILTKEKLMKLPYSN